MVDSLCFVQFSHPGREHAPNRGCEKAWHKLTHLHMRKFMQLHGRWIDEDGNRRTGDLHAWGEWEPESEVVAKLDPPDGSPRHPRYLWRPFYVPREDYRGLHNTDPFIFGERFLYSNCRQNRCGLRHMADGSVIAFGSGKKVDGERRWMLDTVLVVRDSRDYNASDAHRRLRDWVPAAFLDVTADPLRDNGEEASTTGSCPPPRGAPLRLYRGAAADDPGDGMFSFFPAIPAGVDSSFPRPFVDLSGEYFNPRNWRAAKVRRDCTPSELRGLWDQLVAQVRDAGLVLGTRAELPERR